MYSKRQEEEENQLKVVLRNAEYGVCYIVLVKAVTEPVCMQVVGIINFNPDRGVERSAVEKQIRWEVLTLSLGPIICHRTTTCLVFIWSLLAGFSSAIACKPALSLMLFFKR